MSSFHVTVDDTSVIYVLAYRCAGGLKKVQLRSGSRAIDRFFNVPFGNGTTLFKVLLIEWTPSIAQWDLNSQP